MESSLKSGWSLMKLKENLTRPYPPSKKQPKPWTISKKMKSTKWSHTWSPIHPLSWFWKQCAFFWKKRRIGMAQRRWWTISGFLIGWKSSIKRPWAKSRICSRNSDWSQENQNSTLSKSAARVLHARASRFGQRPWTATLKSQNKSSPKRKKSLSYRPNSRLKTNNSKSSRTNWMWSSRKLPNSKKSVIKLWLSNKNLRRTWSRPTIVWSVLKNLLFFLRKKVSGGKNKLQPLEKNFWDSLETFSYQLPQSRTLVRLQELIESQCWTLGSKNSHNS